MLFWPSVKPLDIFQWFLENLSHILIAVYRPFKGLYTCILEDFAGPFKGFQRTFNSLLKVFLNGLSKAFESCSNILNGCLKVF